MSVNGKNLDLSNLNEKSIKGLLTFYKIDPGAVAIEKNGDMVAKELWEIPNLADSDKIEIIKFVGGRLMIPKKCLYPILDTEHCEKYSLEPFSLVKIWEKFPETVPFFQLRSKNLSDPELKNLYLALKKSTNLPIILNDRLELALSLGSYGVHLGKEDFAELSNSERIKLEGFQWKGTSSHSIEDLKNLSNLWDYTGFGPIFPTNSKKTENPVLGLNTLESIAPTIKIPLVAIGGIELEHIPILAKISNVVPASISLFSKSEIFPQIVSLWCQNIA